MVLPPLNSLLLARSTHAVQLESNAPPRYLLYTETERERETHTHTQYGLGVPVRYLLIANIIGDIFRMAGCRKEKEAYGTPLCVRERARQRACMC